MMPGKVRVHESRYGFAIGGISVIGHTLHERAHAVADAGQGHFDGHNTPFEL